LLYFGVINGNANANKKESGGGSNMLHLQDQGLYEGFFSIDKKDECEEVYECEVK